MFNLKIKLNISSLADDSMKTVSMLEFRNRAESVLQQVSKGQAFVLTYRGRPVARLEPVGNSRIDSEDPIYRLGELASGGAGQLTNAEIDESVYGR
jgi:prevent-host-death family protein